MTTRQIVNDKVSKRKSREDKPANYNIKHYIGHRSRLKQKWLENNPKNFLDYELVELLLFYTIPRRDVKPLAKKLLNHFASFNKLIFATKESAIQIDELNTNTCIILSLIAEIVDRLLKEKILFNFI